VRKESLARQDIGGDRRSYAEHDLRRKLRRSRHILAGGLESVSVDVRRLVATGMRIRHLGATTLIAHVQAAILFRLAHLFAGQSTSNERRRQYQQRHAQAGEFMERDHVSIVDEMAAVAVSQVT
jgi:hypothetical protein